MTFRMFAETARHERLFLHGHSVGGPLDDPTLSRQDRRGGARHPSERRWRATGAQKWWHRAPPWAILAGREASR